MIDLVPDEITHEVGYIVACLGDRVGDACSTLIIFRSLLDLDTPNVTSVSSEPCYFCILGAVGAKGEVEDAEAEGQGGEQYVTKVRSIFPSLKVRDGKRVLMKKSHTYYQQRTSGSDASSSRTTQSSLVSPQKRNRSLAERARTSSPGRASLPNTEADALEQKGVSNPNRNDYTECGGESRGGSDEKNIGGAIGEEANAMDGSGSEAELRSVRVDSGGRGKSRGQDKVHSSSRSKAKRQSKRVKESASELSAGIPQSNITPQSMSEEAAMVAEGGIDETGGKTSVQDRPPKRPKISGEKKEPSAEAGDGGRDEDPYSSSEELPIPGRWPVQGKALVDVGGKAKSAILPVGVSNSGVKEVVLHRKRKGSKMKVSNMAARGDTSNQKSGDNAEDFSVDAMLQARGLKETLGLGAGAGMSAWD